MNDPARWPPFDSSDDDAVFADIVAHLNDDVAEAERAAEPPGGDAAAATQATDNQATDETTDETTSNQATGQPLRVPDSGTGDRPPAPPTPGDPQPVPAPQVWRAHEVDDEYEEHFEPPPTSPLPVGDLQFWAIIAGMGGGPLLLLYLVFFNRDASSYWLLTAIAISVGGFALLVSRLPRHHEDDDDGARL